MIDTLDAETNLIGAICVDQKTVRVAAKYLTADDFRSSACGTVFDAALDADSRGKLFDGYMAADVLKGKTQVRVKFVAKPHRQIGEIYGVRLVKNQ